ncbi:MAG: ROK family protein [Planctomycetaceae bacterium]|nr:ROK family protein [Planctomycetaceae bacterium]MCA9111905.1 ROK family protein [Planctomycetaceae bacterium]
MTAEQRNKWIGFDLGGTKMLSRVYDGDFKPLGWNRKKTKAHLGTKAGLERVVETIRDALKDADVDPSEIAGIGIGCPGPIDMEKGVVLDPPNLGWGKVSIRKHLEQEFGCPVAVANDVDAGVYGEYRFGSAKGVRTVIGVFPGTGIGGGCIYEGAILRGSKCSCVEIGHIPVLPDGPLCGCGQRGCLEAVASRLAVAASAARSVYRGEAPYLQKAAGTDLSSIRSSSLANAIKAGDEAIEQIVRDAAHHIGTALAGVIHLISPDVVVLGGGLVEAMPKLFVEDVMAAARDRVMVAYRDTFKVVATELGDDAGVLGAAAWAEKMVVGQSTK